MLKLIDHNLCSGCGACAYVCPKRCISIQENELGVLLPFVNYDNCVECGKCRQVCPALNPVELKNPIKVYAAQSADLKTANNGASGGIASEIYYKALNVGYSIVGASFDDDFVVRLKLTKNPDEVILFQNSKYVFSEIYDLYEGIKKLLNNGEKAVIIALPCQAAAIKKVFKSAHDLFFVDIVCHGTAPYSYLRQHIEHIETKYGHKAVQCYFRDPQLGTNTFTFSLYDRNANRFYSKRTKDGDTYQYGYHRHISYRENCYNCPYAKSQRVGDITIADFPGLNRGIQFNNSRKNISCVLINSERGLDYINDLLSNKKIYLCERPIDEAVNGNRQLRLPTDRPKYRDKFIHKMLMTKNDFEKSMGMLMYKGLIMERVKKISALPVRVLKKMIK